MVSNINDQYYSETMGSLTGFSQVNSATDNPNIPVVGWSVEQLTAFLRNQNEQNFPNKDWIIAVETDIDAHLADLNNPHQVTISQIADNFVEQILQVLVPGTIPNISPFYSFDAEAQLPIGDVFPATVTHSNLYRLRSDASFENTDTVLEYVGIDYSQNIGGLPLFSTITNTVPSNWESLTTTVINTLVASFSGGSQAYCPGPLYTFTETITTGLFGASIPFTETDGYSYTFNVYLLSAGYPGSVKIQEVNDTANYAFVSLDTGESVTSSQLVQCETFMYPNGILKVSYSFPAPTTLGHAVTITFYDANTTVGPRSGLPNRNVFSLAYPTVTRSPMGHPDLISNTATGVSSPMTLTTANFINPTHFSEFMTVLSIWLYPTTSAFTLNDTSILSFGMLTITRDYQNIYVNINDVVVFTSAIQYGLNKIAVSYSPNEVICKDSNNPRVTVPGAYVPNPTAVITVGPFGGYLIDHQIYSMADYNQCLEFLVDG